MLIVIEDISSLQTHRSTLLIRSLRPHSIEYFVGIEEQGKRSNLVFGNNRSKRDTELKCDSVNFA